jgi:hypothetical protein
MLEVLVLGLMGYIVHTHVGNMKRLGEEARNAGKQRV